MAVRTLIILFLSCSCLFGQTAQYGPFTKFASSGFNYGSLFLFVDAKSANSTNANNNDVVTTLADWGTNPWAITYPNTQNGRFFNDTTLSNNLPCIIQTNTAPGSSGTGFAVPHQWMVAADTNFTVTFVVLPKAPPQSGGCWIASEENSISGGTPGYTLLAQSTLALESFDVSGTVDVISGNLVYATNKWQIITLVHGTAGNFVVYTNNISAFTGGPGNSKAIGFNSASSHPQFLGAFSTGTPIFWCGAWKRVMMWKYALSGSDRTNYYNQLKIELGLSGLP